MTRGVDHVTVCVCTFKRPQALAALLQSLEQQDTAGEFSFSIIVVDNDRHQTAAATCAEFASSSAIPLEYHVEPEQNIARARNRAVGHATGQFVALIDDDEIPGRDWLLALYQAQHQFKFSGVLGPVLPLYESAPPQWILAGRFHERPHHATGTVLDWRQTRTGNAFILRTVFQQTNEPFRPAFGMGGEDRDFFKRMTAAGHRFVWSEDAPVWEVVPAKRCSRSFMLRRALLRGTIPHFGWRHVATSLVAVPAYTLMLPFCLLLGHHVLMKYLIKNFDHMGRLLAILGVKVIRQKYVIE